MKDKDLQSLLEAYQTIDENDKLRGLQSFLSYTRIKRKFESQDEFEINPQMKGVVEISPENIFQDIGDPSSFSVEYYLNHSKLSNKDESESLKKADNVIVTVAWYFEYEDGSLGSIYNISQMSPKLIPSGKDILEFFKSLTTLFRFYVHFGTRKKYDRAWIQSLDDEMEQRARTKIKIEKLIPQAQILSISRS